MLKNMQSYELSFDDLAPCSVIRFESKVSMHYLDGKHFNEHDLRGQWGWFKRQIPSDQNFSNIGILNFMAVHRERQSQGLGRRSLHLAMFLMKKAGITVAFLEADPYINFIEDDILSDQLFKQREDFYISEGWVILDSYKPHPPRKHLWINFEALQPIEPKSVIYQSVNDEVFDEHVNKSNLEGHIEGTGI